MKSQAQCLRSFNPRESKPAPDSHKKRHEIFVKVVDLKEKMYSDQTGNFSYLSNKVMQNIIIDYHTN